MEHDVRQIVDSLTPEQRESLRATPEADLVRFHRTLGRGLRNGFRSGRFPALSAYCHAAVRESGTTLSFDTLSSVAVREVWRSLQSAA